MSRIGKMPITVPAGVKIDISGQTVTVQGPKGKLFKALPDGVQINLSEGQINVAFRDPGIKGTALLGLSRTLVANMVEGVTAGFKKVLEINGVGYRAELKGPILNLALGYSHPVEYPLPEGISVEIEKQTKISVQGIDKELVGSTAAKIRSFRRPEPYKGKGIKYSDERIMRKAGKAGKK